MTKNISDKPGDAAPSEDRRQFLKTASLLGAAGAVAGAMHGKFGLAPVTQAQAQTRRRAAGEMVAVEMGRRPTRPAPRTTSRPPRCSTPSKWIRDGKVYKIGRVYERACRCSARAPSRCAFPAARPAARSARTSWSITTNISRHRDRPGRHAVRRARPYRHPARQGRRQERDAFLQRLHGGRDQRRLRPEEARDREAEAAVHARPPGRHPGA